MSGIGGRTIQYAKANITKAEIQIWSAYRKKRGSLFIGRRIEQAFGNFSATYLASKGAKDVDPLSFMVHEDKPEEEVLTVDEMMQRGLTRS